MPLTHPALDYKPAELAPVRLPQAEETWVESESAGVGEVPVSEDMVDQYLNEIGRVPRIDHAEEIQLSRLIQRKLKLEAVQQELSETYGNPASLDDLAQHLQMDLRSLRAQIRQGERAQQKLINANLRLVVSVAKKYLNRGVPFLDLIQEGNIGLIRATEKFDAERGYRFSTYAHWWIRQGITRCIANQARTIRLPVHMVDKVRLLKRTARDLMKSNGRRPTESELAQALGVQVKKLRLIQQAASLPVSLDVAVGHEGESRLGDLLEDEHHGQPFQTIVHQSLQQDVRKAMQSLKAIEVEVLELRYGLNGKPARTLREVGEHFNLTRERIRQIEKDALRKLKLAYPSKDLCQYIR